MSKDKHTQPNCEYCGLFDQHHYAWCEKEKEPSSLAIISILLTIFITVATFAAGIISTAWSFV